MSEPLPAEAPQPQPWFRRRVLGSIVYAFESAYHCFEQFLEALIKKKMYVLTWWCICVMTVQLPAVIHSEEPLWIFLTLLLPYTIFTLCNLFQHLKMLKLFRIFTLSIIFFIIITTVINIITYIITRPRYVWFFYHFMSDVLIFLALLVQLHLINDVIFDIEQHGIMHTIFTNDDETSLVGPNNA